MKYGIYYAYWEKEWGGNPIPYVQRVKKLGFDVLEVACGDFYTKSDSFFKELKCVADGEGIMLTGGYGPRKEHNLASKNSTLIEGTFEFYEDMFRKMELAGIGSIGGALYSYWPVDFAAVFDKVVDLELSACRMQRLADMAANHGIELNMEVLNRFEGYLINDCDECLEYVKAVNKNNVHVMLDTFHMNIEEDSFSHAINKAGNLLGHLHVGEANRRPPHELGRIPWVEIGKALHDIGYKGTVVMEPFVRMGGQVGKDISIWRDISQGASDDDLDAAAAASVSFLRQLWG